MNARDYIGEREAQRRRHEGPATIPWRQAG